jgi:hypothetical protein
MKVKNLETSGGTETVIGFSEKQGTIPVVKPMKGMSPLGNGGANRPVKSTDALFSLCQELQALQRQRAIYIKSRIMVANRLQAIVAGTIGYHSGMGEGERRKTFAAAGKLVKQIVNDEVASDLRSLVMTHVVGIDEFERMQRALEKEMIAIARRLPVAAWVERPEQRGFGLLFLAIVVGETGDLANYANPGKVWRRLGCAPYTKDGETLMGATWRSRSKSKTQTKLNAVDWEDFGYSPRRRSISYLIGEGMVKLNGKDSPEKIADFGGRALSQAV